MSQTYPPAPQDDSGEPRGDASASHAAQDSEPWSGPGAQPPYGQQGGQYGPPPYGQVPYGQAPYGQPPYGQAPYGQERKSRVAAGLFGIFLGALGVHNFYLGYTGKAVAQLLITLLSFGLLSWVSAMWGLVEGILILTQETGPYSVDARGVPLQ